MFEDIESSFGIEYSKSCCPYSTKPVQNKFKLSLSAGNNELISVQGDTPSIPLGATGIRVGATIALKAGVSVNISAETSCSLRQVCAGVEGNIDFGGGLYGEFIHPKVLRGDLLFMGNGTLETPDACFNFATWNGDIGKPKICIRPKVVGQIRLMSFVKKSIEANLGPKVCKKF